VLVLQASPILGVSSVASTSNHPGVIHLGALLIGSLALTAHVFVFNDWAGHSRDSRDPRGQHSYLVGGALPGVRSRALQPLSSFSRIRLRWPSPWRRTAWRRDRSSQRSVLVFAEVRQSTPIVGRSITSRRCVAFFAWLHLIPPSTQVV